MPHVSPNPILSFLGAATVLAAADAHSSAAVPLVLENDAVRAEIVPAWAGRLTFFGRPGGTNASCTQP